MSDDNSGIVQGSGVYGPGVADEIARLTRERDEVRDLHAVWRDAAITAKRERDEARAEVERLRAAGRVIVEGESFRIENTGKSPVTVTLCRDEKIDTKPSGPPSRSWLVGIDPGQPGGSAPLEREALGRIVRETWVAYCIATQGESAKRSHVAPWEELDYWDREVDCRIGEAVAKAVMESVAADNALWDELAPKARTVLAGRKAATAGALALIAAERASQIAKGFDAKHDDEHDAGELAHAAAFLAFGSAPGARDGNRWPYDTTFASWMAGWSRERQLVIAGAFIVAEIERARRAAESYRPQSPISEQIVGRDCAMDVLDAIASRDLKPANADIREAAERANAAFAGHEGDAIGEGAL